MSVLSEIVQKREFWSQQCHKEAERSRSARASLEFVLVMTMVVFTFFNHARLVDFVRCLFE